MADWHTDRRPTAADADPLGMVRWGPTHPGLLCHWSEVRPGLSLGQAGGTAWERSSAELPLLWRSWPVRLWTASVFLGCGGRI